MTVQEAARELYEAFETAKRSDGTEFKRLKDGSPQWMTDVCRKAHFDGSDVGMLPDDWRFRFIEEAAGAIADMNDADDESEVFDNIEADVYTYELTDWLGSRADRYGYVDEAVSDFGHGKSLLDDLQAGQVREKEEVFGLVRNALREHVEAVTV